MEGRFVCSELDKDATSEAGKYLFRAANVWGRVARCLDTIDVCIWCMFVFMSVVVTVWGYVAMFVV